jgi:hypothetical protein
VSAIVSVRDGSVRQLDSRAEPDQEVTEEQVKDLPQLARILMSVLRDLALLKRRWWPRSITFRDIVSTGSSGSPQTFRLTHNFGGAVEYEVVDIALPGTVAIPLVSRAGSSDQNTLVVQVYYEATLAIRVTEGG